MHSHLLEHASREQLIEFCNNMFSELKEKMPEVYEKLEMELYETIYGCHFNEYMLNKALSCMENEDGTKGGHWSLEQTNNIANVKGFKFDSYNEYDFNYVMNMMYSDYYGAIPNENESYFKLAKKFLDDKDAPKGKAFRYYIKVVK